MVSCVRMCSSIFINHFICKFDYKIKFVSETPKEDGKKGNEPKFYVYHSTNKKGTFCKLGTSDFGFIKIFTCKRTLGGFAHRGTKEMTQQMGFP